MSDFMEIFDKYKEEGKLKSEQFQYWNKFLEEIIPILRDLTRSHREGTGNSTYLLYAEPCHFSSLLIEQITAVGLLSITKTALHRKRTSQQSMLLFSKVDLLSDRH